MDAVKVRALGQNQTASDIAADQPVAPATESPDAAARRERIFGDRVIPAVEVLAEERSSRY